MQQAEKAMMSIADGISKIVEPIFSTMTISEFKVINNSIQLFVERNIERTMSEREKENLIAVIQRITESTPKSIGRLVNFVSLKSASFLDPRFYPLSEPLNP